MRDGRARSLTSVAPTLESFRAGQTLQSFARMGRPQADPRPHDHDELGAHVSAAGGVPLAQSTPRTETWTPASRATPRGSRSRLEGVDGATPVLLGLIHLNDSRHPLGSHKHARDRAVSSHHERPAAPRGPEGPRDAEGRRRCERRPGQPRATTEPPLGVTPRTSSRSGPVRCDRSP